MQLKYNLLPIMILAVFIFLNGCNTSLEKPSGLNNEFVNNQPVISEYNEVDGPYITQTIVIDEKNNIPLLPTDHQIKAKSTVLDALISITKENNIPLEYTGGKGSGAYIISIDNVSSGDKGPGSGWMFRINGQFPDRGAGVIKLCSGDVVEWLYTTELGKELNGDFKPLKRKNNCND